jgi:hypothetical protein
VLLQRADVAMFDAKANQRLVTIYDPGRLGGGAERLNVARPSSAWNCS